MNDSTSGNFTIGGNTHQVSCNLTNCGDHCPICHPVRYCQYCGRRLGGYHYEPYPWYPQVPWYVPNHPFWYTTCGSTSNANADVTYSWNTQCGHDG